MSWSLPFCSLPPSPLLRRLRKLPTPMRRWPTSSRRLAMSGRLRECRSRYSLDRSMDRPVDRDAGVSASQERKWGLIGGLVGTVVGGGSAAVAVGMDGASVYETGLDPRSLQAQRGP